MIFNSMISKSTLVMFTMVTLLALNGCKKEEEKKFEEDPYSINHSLENDEDDENPEDFLEDGNGTFLCQSGTSGRSSFSQVDLSGKELENIKCAGQNMRHALLMGANLTDANFAGTDLSYADLRGAILRSASLRSADLSYADLTGVILDKSDLTGADLSHAKLVGTSFDGAILNEVNWGDNLEYFLEKIQPPTEDEDETDEDEEELVVEG